MHGGGDVLDFYLYVGTSTKNGRGRFFYNGIFYVTRSRAEKGLSQVNYVCLYVTCDLAAVTNDFLSSVPNVTQTLHRSAPSFLQCGTQYV